MAERQNILTYPVKRKKVCKLLALEKQDKVSCSRVSESAHMIMVKQELKLFTDLLHSAWLTSQN